jgi:hypothetical protein
MKNGLSRFTFYLEQIKALLNNARKQKNPSLWLFSNNARSPFFMLESLAKIYAKMHNPKMFGNLKDKFKFIEDVAGTNYHFVNVENDVHELRRKLRWLSIYPQSLRGAIQFAPDMVLNKEKALPRFAWLQAFFVVEANEISNLRFVEDICKILEFMDTEVDIETRYCSSL